MMESHRDALRFAASQLVFVAALLHLGLGLIEWSRYVAAGFLVPPDLRWPAFVVTGLVILVGLWLAYRTENERPYYLLGVLAMLAYVFAYFAWHLGGHRLGLVIGRATSHPLTLQFVVDHYFAGLMETFALTVELVAAVLLGVLYVFAE